MTMVLPLEDNFVIYPGDRNKYYHALEEIHKALNIEYRKTLWESTYDRCADNKACINVITETKEIGYCGLDYYKKSIAEYGKIYSYEEIFSSAYDIDDITNNLDILANKLK